MTFLIRPPHRVKKSRTKNAQTILDRLKNFLDHNTDEPVEILCSFWEDQSNAVTYHELRDAVKTGEFNQKQFEEWQQDYSVLVAEKLTPIWKMAMAAGPAGQPLFDNLSFSINMQNPGIANWIKERGAEFVTSCSAEQKKAIQSLLAKKIVEEHTVDELARFIRPCIGLTDGDTKAVLKLYDSVAEKLKTEHPRMKPESIRKKALDAAQKYAEKKHRQRAFTIAQTELEFAYNRGADYGVRQAQEAGLLGTTRKRWITSGDDAVCPTCAALDGTEIEMDDSFDFKGRLLFAGQKMLPPAHPRCACAVEYIEDQNSIRTQITQTQPVEQPATDSLQMEGDVSDFARETAQTTKEVFFDKFGVQSNIDTIRMNDTDFTDLLSGTLAYVRPESPNVLHLNPLFFRDEESFYSSLGGRIRAYHRNASPGSIIAHEYAHSIENNLDSVAIVGDVAEEYIKKHPKDAMDMFLADYQVAGETISHYAGTTEHEFWSEAFGDVFANGENASEVSMNLVNRAKEILGIA